MKKVIYAFIVFLGLLGVQSKAQVFYVENFNVGCFAGQIASAAVNSPTNGAWAITNIAAFPSNGADANEWFISAAEEGAAIGACSGNPCGVDRTMHIGANQVFPAFVDAGSSYLAGGANNTNKRVESAPINCTGKFGVQLSFEYSMEGIPGADFAEVWYNSGLGWVMLTPLAPSGIGPCFAGQALWTFTTVGLPATANNNPNVQIGFRWQNNNGAAIDPAIAIDDINLATMQISTNTLVLCPQQVETASVSINAPGIASYTWTSFPAVTFGSPNADPTTITYPAAGVYTIVLLGSQNPGGVATATAITTVTVNSILNTVSAAPLNQTVCPTANATITASGATTYTWSIGVNGPSIGTGSAITVTFPTASVVPYFVQGQVGSCLSNSMIANVTYSNIPFAIPVAPSAITVCPTGTISLTAAGATSYTWNVPGNPTLTPNTAVITDTPAASGIYTVSGTQGGCIGTGTVDVSVQNIPLSLTVTPSTPSICLGQTVTLNVSGANGYTWTPPATLSSSTGVTVDAFPVVTTTYNVFGEMLGCTGNTQVVVVIAPGPNLNINTTANAVCTGYTSTITASGAMTYSWTGTTFTGSIVQPSISVGSGSYSVIATSTAFACPTISAVTIFTLGPLNIGGSQTSLTTCIENNSPKFSQPVTLTAFGGSSYNWAPCIGGYLSICIGNSVIARPQTTTQYTVTGFSSVCSGSAVITVTVIPQTTISVVPPSPITCLGSCLNFSVVNTTTALPTPYTYSWTVPFDVTGSIINPLSPTVVACPTISATYSVEMKDARGCATEQRLVSTTIIPQPVTAVSIPTINGVPTNSVCYVGDIVGLTTNTLLLTAENKNTNPALPPGVVPTYTWGAVWLPTNPMYNDGAIKTETYNPSVIISPPTKLPAVRTFTVRSSFNGISGCYREDTISVRVVDCRQVTRVTFTTVVVNDTICARQCVTFTNTTDAGGPQTFTWTFKGGAPAASFVEAPTVCYNLPGKWDVYLIVDNPYGGAVQTGSFQFSKVVDVPNTTIIPPGMTASDTTIRFGMSVDLTGSGAVRYDWSPNYMITNLTGPKTTVSPHQSTQYILTGYNSKGCASNDTINVFVIDDCGEMYIPNAFSPNNQDHPENETLKVYGFCLETMTFQVFNRWGQKVFETTDQTVGWDGTFNGEPLNSGVFVYRLEAKDFKGKGFSLKGNVTLVR